MTTRHDRAEQAPSQLIPGTRFGNPGKHPLVLVLVAVLLVFMLAGCGGDDEKPEPTAAPAAAATPDPDELAVTWWKWATQRPKGQDPVSDKTGVRCAQDQPDDVFFLAGTTGGAARRDCEVPAGRPLFFPVLNVWCPRSVGRASCGDVVRDADIRVTVDGERVDTRVIASCPCAAEPNPRSPLAVRGSQFVDAGHYALVDGLDPGKHRVKFSGLADDFGVGAVYDLTVR